MVLSSERAAVVAASAVSVAACTRETAEDGTWEVEAAPEVACGAVGLWNADTMATPATTATTKHSTTAMATKARLRGSRRRRACGGAWTGTPEVWSRRRRPTARRSRDVDARPRSQFGMRGGASVARSSDAVGFGVRNGSGAHTGSVRLTFGRESAWAPPCPSAGVCVGSCGGFVCGGGFVPDPGPESLGLRRSPSTRTAPRNWTAALARSIRRLRLLRRWALRPRRVRGVLVAQRRGVSGGDSHSMGPVGPEGKSLRKSPGQSP